MKSLPTTLTHTFARFFDSEKAGALALAACTLIALLLANSPLGPGYLQWWQVDMAGLTRALWVNDALMAIFFLLIGLELEREIYSGELSSPRHALLPIFAALGGMLAPALIHLVLNQGSPTSAGAGIPMATDIAFALGALAILGKRVPASLKVFVVAFAVIDDLGAILVIAIFYTPRLSLGCALAAGAVMLAMVAMNRGLRIMALAPYLIGGALLWFLMLRSGVHATLAGVLLAFAIPYSHRDEDRESPSHRLENWLHKPVAFVILPIFALANTAIVLGDDSLPQAVSPNGFGIFLGLVAGKPLGVMLMAFLAVKSGVCALPAELGWRHVFGAGLLGGIGFTMSIFIANLAFPDSANVIDASKIAILAASSTAALLGCLWLNVALRGADEKA